MRVNSATRPWRMEVGVCRGAARVTLVIVIWPNTMMVWIGMRTAP